MNLDDHPNPWASQLSGAVERKYAAMSARAGSFRESVAAKQGVKATMTRKRSVVETVKSWRGVSEMKRMMRQYQQSKEERDQVQILMEPEEEKRERARSVSASSKRTSATGSNSTIAAALPEYIRASKLFKQAQKKFTRRRQQEQENRAKEILEHTEKERDVFLTLMLQKTFCKEKQNGEKRVDAVAYSDISDSDDVIDFDDDSEATSQTEYKVIEEPVSPRSEGSVVMYDYLMMDYGKGNTRNDRFTAREKEIELLF